MRIAICIPCLNEAATIGAVIDSFRRALPEAEICVCDNNSRDGSAEKARQAGATVFVNLKPGKGSTVREMLSRIDADIYILVDGDGTYRAEEVHLLLQPVAEGRADMFIGNRLRNYQSGSFPRLHIAGNKLIRFLTYKLHGVDIPDMLSGYRVMNRSLVDELCLISGGFEIETEINIKSVWHGFRIGSANISYHPRPSGSCSKLKTFQDGYRILATILMLLKEYQPMTMGGLAFFSLQCFALLFLILGAGRRSLFAFGLGLLFSLSGTLALSVGLILNALNISHREVEESLRKISHRRPPQKS